MIMIEIQYRGGSRDFKGFHGLLASDRPMTSLYSCFLKYLRPTKISVLSHNHLPEDFITIHSLSLLFTSKSLSSLTDAP